MIDQDPATPAPEGPKHAVAYLLLGAFALLLIPVVIGWYMANTEAGGTDDASGMDGGDIVVTTDLGTNGTEPDALAGSVNLALQGTVVDVSSEFNENFAGANAIDGSLSTEWSTLGDGDDAYIVIDLGAQVQVAGFGFRSREMSDGSAVTNAYTITVDGGEPIGPFAAGLGLTTSEYAVTGQVFRFDMEETTGGNTGAIELEIYGA